MEQETKIVEPINNKCKCKNQNMSASSGAVYGMGVIGAAIYFIQHADTFWIGLLGVLKAIIWPALLIHKLLEFLKF